jgi:uncharacterized protein
MYHMFIDTSGWGHLVDPGQQHHALSSDIYRTVRQQRNRIITSNYVIAELVALLTSPLRVPRSRIIAFVDGIRTSPYVEIVHVDEGLEQKAWNLLRNRQDKDWSLVDCTSFVLMEQQSLFHSLTTDHHFEQAGFTCLLQ